MLLGENEIRVQYYLDSLTHRGLVMFHQAWGTWNVITAGRAMAVEAGLDREDDG